MAADILQLNDATFDEEVLASPLPVLWIFGLIGARRAR
jgi:hypothetical protein